MKGGDRMSCSGAGNCPAPLHVHGCFADRDGAACDDPNDHSPAPSAARDTTGGETTVEAEARALREAADDWTSTISCSNCQYIRGWLRARADRLAGGTRR